MEFRESFSLTECDPKDFGIQIIRLLCYRGKLSDPQWVDQDECEFFPPLPRVFNLTQGHLSVFLSTLYYPRGPGECCEGPDPEDGFKRGLLPARL